MDAFNYLTVLLSIILGLAITQRTVKFHVSSILSKLGAGNRTEAVSLAAQRGLVELRGA